MAGERTLAPLECDVDSPDYARLTGDCVTGVRSAEGRRGVWTLDLSARGLESRRNFLIGELYEERER